MDEKLAKIGPKDFITGCLVIIVAVLIIPILIIIFKISIYLAIVVGVIVAIILGIALFGRLIRLMFFRRRARFDNNDGE
jgi:hypothetical protein